MNSKEVLISASKHLDSLTGHKFDLLTVAKPISPNAAVNLSKIVSKLSPLLANLIEFNIVEFLNDQPEYQDLGTWKRQDPGFPDAIFDGDLQPPPGFEIKAWFPLATEITARFKDSQNHFLDDQTNVCLIAWLPDQLIFGKPKIIDMCVLSGLSVAQARDDHYHNPPDYLVLEPGDTKKRTRNLQQTNTNGHKFQGTPERLEVARRFVEGWGPEGQRYHTTPEYQALLRELMNKYTYRLDTNFAKIDRFGHQGIEEFKRKVLGTNIHGLTVRKWRTLIGHKSDTAIRKELQDRFDIKEEDVAEILE